MNIFRMFAPNHHKCGYSRMPRKMKKAFKKHFWGFHPGAEFHGAYRLQKQWNKVMPPVFITKRKGKFIWAYCASDKYYWRILYSPNTGILDYPKGYANDEIVESN